ncbi:MAG: TlpA family protein disulfide reductase [Halomonas sp.]|nr:TlpA disulfide reductase family protein [Halomonas sp.]MDN6337114.1 TlpA family protein disulfide reductase [Halomonas sp.]
MLSLTLGPLAISVGQALIVLAFLVALVAGKLSARRRDVAIGDAIINLALVGFVVARLVFVGRYFASYGWSPLAWIDIRDGGFEIIAGLLAIGVYGGYLAWRRAALRRPLFMAAFAGLLTWGLTGGALSLIENQASRPPEATLYTLDNEAIDLAHLQQTSGNRPMVVNLWATWCPPCRKEMPLLEDMQEKHADVLFVLVNQGETRPTIQNFLEHMQLDLDQVLLDRQGEIGQQAGSTALPTTLFYDASGRLVASHLGELSAATLRRALERFDLPPE